MSYIFKEYFLQIHQIHANAHLITKISMNKKANRTSSKIDQSSMADIGFLLLIFFLVSTTIDIDKGLLVKLPLYEPNSEATPTSHRNICQIHLNAKNEIMVRGEQKSMSEVSPFIKEFIMNPERRYKFASRPNKAVIAINNDRASLYHEYIALYNEIKKAYNELWEEQAVELFQRSFASCSKDERKSIKKRIPLIISESEPKAFYLEAR